MARTIGVAGAGGFLGTALCSALAAAGHAVTPITRHTSDRHRPDRFDVLINTAMPSRRFWARQHPELDFIETVRKTADFLYGWHFEKYVHISSVSARCERDTVYGRHKAAAEALCDARTALVVRLTALYGPAMIKGALVDIARDAPVFVDGESRYAFTPVDYAARWIAAHLDDTGIVEVGARNTVSLREVADALGRTIEFSGPRELQEVAAPRPEFPDARDVLAFARTLADAER